MGDVTWYLIYKRFINQLTTGGPSTFWKCHLQFWWNYISSSWNRWSWRQPSWTVEPLENSGLWTIFRLEISYVYLIIGQFTLLVEFEWFFKSQCVTNNPGEPFWAITMHEQLGILQPHHISTYLIKPYPVGNFKHICEVSRHGRVMPSIITLTKLR